MTGRFIIAIDQGTTSSRVVLIDETGTPVHSVSEDVEQIYPQPGWVEHDAAEIWRSVEQLLHSVVDRAGGADQIAAIGITNQRETTVVWDRTTGEPLHNAIVWQDRRTSDLCAQLRSEGLGGHVHQTTGLLIDPYFSGTKVSWLLDNVDGARARAVQGQLCFGTVDSWLIWNLTGGCLACDRLPAMRRAPCCIDIAGLDWDETLLERLDLSRACMLPEVRPSQGPFRHHTGSGAHLASPQVPILGVAGDQQAATFGQACFEPGMIKSTYGTGCFMLANSGPQMAQLRKPSARDHCLAKGIGNPLCAGRQHLHGRRHHAVVARPTRLVFRCGGDGGHCRIGGSGQWRVSCAGLRRPWSALLGRGSEGCRTGPDARRRTGGDRAGWTGGSGFPEVVI